MLVECALVGRRCGRLPLADWAVKMTATRRNEG